MTQLMLSFVIGVVASIAAGYLLLWRQQRRLRLRFRSILALIIDVAHQLRRDGFTPDYIVTVDRNSGIVGSILAGHVGLRSVVSVSTINERTPNGTRTVRIDNVSLVALGALGGMRVLVLICCNDSGSSLQAVVRQLASQSPPPSALRTAALYTSPSPAIVPTYRAVVVGKDTRVSMNRIISRLPWMTSEWQHVFASERLT